MAQSLLQELIKVVKLPINTDGLCSHLGRYVNQHFFSIKGFIHTIDMISWVILQSEPSYCVGIVLDQTAISDQLGYIYINEKPLIWPSQCHSNRRCYQMVISLCWSAAQQAPKFTLMIN